MIWHLTRSKLIEIRSLLKIRSTLDQTCWKCDQEGPSIERGGTGIGTGMWDMESIRYESYRMTDGGGGGGGDWA